MSASSSHASTGNNNDICINLLLAELLFLDSEILRPMERKLKDVNINRAQCAALVTEYQNGLKDISVQLNRLILLVGHSSSFYLYQDTCGVERNHQFWLCVYSLAELGRCLETGAFYISSCAIPELHRALLKLNPLAGRTETLSIGNRTLSLTSSSLLREFLFYLELVLVGIQHLSETIDNSGVRIPYPKFQWCAESCRLAIVNETCHWFRLEQHTLLQASSAEELAKEDAIDLRRQLKAGAIENRRFIPWKGQVQKQGIGYYLMQLLDEPTAPDSLPSKFKLDYEDIKEGTGLGSGASGYVVECKWQGENVVVKFVKGALEGPQNRENFEKEVSILASLQHPNTVRIFGFGYKEKTGEGFIVMEQMKAALSRLIRKKENEDFDVPTPFPLDVNLGVLLQIIEGLCYLKERNLMHRDLKPDNVLVSWPDINSDHSSLACFFQVKIADFGTSKFQLDSHYATPKLGTRAYMAPEILATIKGDEMDPEAYRGYTWKADVYSFGIMCSEILTGKRPFNDIQGYAKLLAAVRDRCVRPPLPSDSTTPASLKSLIEDCWNTNPDKRPDVWEIRERLWKCKLHSQFREDIAIKTPPWWGGFLSRLNRYKSKLALPAKQLSTKEKSTNTEALWNSLPSPASGEKRCLPADQAAILRATIDEQVNHVEDKLKGYVKDIPTEKFQSDAPQLHIKPPPIKVVLNTLRKREEARIQKEAQKLEEFRKQKETLIMFLTCVVCQKPTKRRCSRCRGMKYCSRECQAQHWNDEHKYDCRPHMAHRD